MIGAAGLVLLGGAGGAAAVAATQGSGGSRRRAYLNDLAKHLDVSPGALTAAMKAARNEQIEAAVAAGRITKSQGEALKQRAQRGGGAPFRGRGFRARGLGGNGVAARYLDLSTATLRGELQSGKSLAQIASSTPGKSVDGLKAAIASAEKTRLAKALCNGSITSQQEQQRLSGLSSRIEALLQRSGTGGRGHGWSGVAPGSHRPGSPGSAGR